MASPCLTPRKLRTIRGGSDNKESKNPYASRGLDKFSALLAELEEKKQKIYAKIDTDDAPMVRFVYRSTGDCIPIVIKERPDSPISLFGYKESKKRKKTGNLQYEKEKITVTQESQVLNGSKGISSQPQSPSNPFSKKSCRLSGELHRMKRKTGNVQDVKEKIAMTQESKQSKVSCDRETKEPQSQLDLVIKQYCPLSGELLKMKGPSYCLPMTVMLVLVLLALFGRSAAILWTCIAWYMVPTIMDHSSSRKEVEMKKKKEFKRGLSNESKVEMKKKDFTRRLGNESTKGSFNQRTPRDYVALKEKFPCLAARGRSA